MAISLNLFMSVDELSKYFQNIDLPDELRLDRSSRQFKVPERVEYLLAAMRSNPENWRHAHQLMPIKNVLENPYDARKFQDFRMRIIGYQ
jgi:hypothetical protein